MWCPPWLFTCPPFFHYIIYQWHAYRKRNQCIHYADDTTLFSKVNNLDDLIDFTNTELVKLDKWVCAHKLSVNINKAAFSVCSTKSVTDVHKVKIRNEEINLVTNLKFLGITIDSNLSLSSHYQSVCNINNLIFIYAHIFKMCYFFIYILQCAQCIITNEWLPCNS